MKEVFIIGIGQVPVSKDSQRTPVQLATESIKEALATSGIDPARVDALFIGNMMSGMLSNQAQLGPVIADKVGLTGVEALAIDAACASGGNALRLGYMTIAGGFHDVVVAAGVEVMNHVTRDRITLALATGSDWETEGSKGESFISLNARLMRGYMEKYDIEPEVFGHFSMNAHRNACTNPNAMLHKPMSLEDYANARPLSDPIKLSDAPPVSDGSAAIILATREIALDAMRQGFPAIRVSGSAVATDRLVTKDRWSRLELSAVRESAQKAYRHAGITPDDVDFFELHDAYTIITALSLEAAGFADPGRGALFGMDGEIGLNGSLPLSTMGGLKARGHPVGATGLYQAVEACQQLAGRAGDNQVPDCSIGLIQSIGGTGATVVTHVLENSYL